MNKEEQAIELLRKIHEDAREYGHLSRGCPHIDSVSVIIKKSVMRQIDALLSAPPLPETCPVCAQIIEHMRRGGKLTLTRDGKTGALTVTSTPMPPPLPDVEEMTVSECYLEIVKMGIPCSEYRVGLDFRVFVKIGGVLHIFTDELASPTVCWQKALIFARQYLRPQTAPEPEKGESTTRDSFEQPTEITE
jgi:hypothetical protein